MIVAVEVNAAVPEPGTQL